MIQIVVVIVAVIGLTTIVTRMVPPSFRDSKLFGVLLRFIGLLVIACFVTAILGQPKN